MGNVYISSDWHGCGKLARKVFDFLQSNDKLYFLGDAIDRGPHGMYILDKLLNDPRVVFIKGNHEDMMEKLCDGCKNEDDYYWNWDHNGIWEANGGTSTFCNFINNTQEKREWYINKIKNLPKEACYINHRGQIIIMNHAGYLKNKFNSNWDSKREGDPYFWDRTHFNDAWDKSEEKEDVFLVHGHTPVQYLKFHYGYNGKPATTAEDFNAKREFFYSKECTHKPTIIRYCDGHKFDIDMCTVYSKRIALLNLDTFEEIYIDE